MWGQYCSNIIACCCLSRVALNNKEKCLFVFEILPCQFIELCIHYHNYINYHLECSNSVEYVMQCVLIHLNSESYFHTTLSFSVSRTMSKSYKFIDPCGAEVEAGPSTSAQPAKETHWSLCFICQETTPESLTCPSQNARQDMGSSYNILAGYQKRFSELGLLPKSLLLNRLDEGSGIEAALSTNNALYHKTCRLRYNKTKLDRAEKRHRKIEANEEEEIACRKRTRYLSQPSNTGMKQRCEMLLLRRSSW